MRYENPYWTCSFSSVSLLSFSPFLLLSFLSPSFSLPPSHPTPPSPLFAPLARVLRFRLARLDGSQRPSQGLERCVDIHFRHSLVPSGGQPLVRMSNWPRSSNAAIRRTGSTGRSITTTGTSCLALGGAPLQVGEQRDAHQRRVDGFGRGLRVEDASRDISSRNSSSIGSSGRCCCLCGGRLCCLRY